eukprot:Sspe_Gene.58149::Locus_31899_Transcript_1_1_Confidence_1.000_Length_660::g.58149::m.58149
MGRAERSQVAGPLVPRYPSLPRRTAWLDRVSTWLAPVFTPSGQCGEAGLVSRVLEKDSMMRSERLQEAMGALQRRIDENSAKLQPVPPKAPYSDDTAELPKDIATLFEKLQSELSRDMIAKLEEVQRSGAKEQQELTEKVFRYVESERNKIAEMEERISRMLQGLPVDPYPSFSPDRPSQSPPSPPREEIQRKAEALARMSQAPKVDE